MEGIEFRAVTIEAFKGKQGPCFERNQAVIYRGPFREVLDDDNHRMERGVRYAVCDKTYNLYRKAPYREFFEFVEPLEEIPLGGGKPFDCSQPPDEIRRKPRARITKSRRKRAVVATAAAAADGSEAFSWLHRS